MTLSERLERYARMQMMGRTELCAWLRNNSSGVYRPAAEAADEIEHLAAAKDSHFAQAMANGAKAREYRDEADALRKDAELLAWVLQHPETAAECLEDAAAGDGTARSNLERRIAGLTQANAGGRLGAV